MSFERTEAMDSVVNSIEIEVIIKDGIDDSIFFEGIKTFDEICSYIDDGDYVNFPNENSKKVFYVCVKYFKS